MRAPLHRLLRLGVALTAMFFVGASSPPDARSLPAGVSVPFQNEGGVLLLRATLDGAGPLLFTFDPGASDLYTRAARARLNGRTPRTVCLSSVCYAAQMEFFDGDGAQLFPRHDPSLGVLGGSIGPALLQEYVAQIDYRAAILTLTTHEAFHPPPSARGLPLHMDSNGIPALTAAIDGMPAPFELDIRAPRSMLFSPFLRRTRTREHRHSVQIGDVNVPGVEFLLSTATGGQFARSDVAGLLGNDVLSHAVVTIDLPRRSAYVTKPVP